MEPIVESCAGLDIHQASVVACVMSGPLDKKPNKQIRTFGTMHADLTELADWLASCGCTVVAMESTGVYWKPVHVILEDRFDVIVGNAHRIKAVPGRKTDVKDAEWICDLARHGLIARSFVPSKAIRALRDLTRYRRKLTETASTERNRLIRLLESAGIKLAGVVSDVLGVSGEAMIRALIEADRTPAEMAQLAQRRMRRKIPELERALRGDLGEHHRFILRMQLERIKAAETDLARLDQRIADHLAPYHGALSRLLGIPGVDRVTGSTIIAEIGVDMTLFHGAQQLASWAGLCPGSHESAGRRRGGKTSRGNIFLKAALVTAAVAAAKKRGSYLADKYRRLSARRGKLRAAVAIGHKILVEAYHILHDGTYHQDPGPGYLDIIDKRRNSKQLVRRLNQVGFEVTLAPKAP
ncbi:MAG: IS110 family transposase [Acetobacteraceae bacterium]|nr:IS110 family transposase [Acetobacteraceae bacterium]MBV8573815.1 IS110 family transposase [Acetobacteraceae bacterium]